MEQRKGVHHLAAAQGEVPAGPLELGDEEGQVEAGDAEAGQVGVGEQAGDLGCFLCKGGTMGDVLVGDAVNGGGGGWNGALRVEAELAAAGILAGSQPQQRDLDDAVAVGVEAGGLDLEENEWAADAEMFEHGAPPERGQQKTAPVADRGGPVVGGPGPVPGPTTVKRLRLGLGPLARGKRAG
jgi:hypothetical protein